MRLLYSLPLLVLLLTLIGCAKHLDRASQIDLVDPATIWAAFKARSEPLSRHHGFQIKASINYFSPDKNNRVLLTLWGNQGLPVRANLYAGVGSLIGMWSEQEDSWTAYYPLSKTAYVYRNGKDGFSSLGIEIPFSLHDLVLVLQGNISLLIEDSYVQAESMADQNVRFQFSDNALITQLITNNRGLPLSLEGQAASGWILSFDTWDTSQPSPAPKKMTLMLTKNSRAVIRKKLLQKELPTWDSDSIKLELPEETTVIDARTNATN